MEGGRVKLRVSGHMSLLDKPFISFGDLQETWRTFLVRNGARVWWSLPSEVSIESHDNFTLEELPEGVKLTAQLDDQIQDLINKLKIAEEYGVIVRSIDWTVFPGLTGPGVAVGGTDGAGNAWGGAPSPGPYIPVPMRSSRARHATPESGNLAKPKPGAGRGMDGSGAGLQDFQQASTASSDN